MSSGNGRGAPPTGAPTTARHLRERPVRPLVEPGDIFRSIEASPPEDGRADGQDLRRLREEDRAGHDALAASALLRLFPGQCGAGLGGGRVSGLGDGRAMHALADLAGGDRTRNAHRRLDAPGARPARRVFRRHPGFGLVGDAGCRADHARAGARLARQQERDWPGRRGCASIPRIRCTPRSTGRSGSRASARTIWCAFPSAGRFARMDTAALEAAIVADRQAGLLPAGIIACVGGTSTGGTATTSRRSRRSPSGTGSTCMSMPPGPDRR